MRAVIQRVRGAKVIIDGQLISEISNGLLVLLGIHVLDSKPDADYLAEKISRLRVFEDDGGKLNLSVSESGGELMVVSQFTLYGDCRKGNRPSFTVAAKQETAKPLYDYFLEKIGELVGSNVKTGVFSADMRIELVNDGPVTILLDSGKAF